MDGLPYGTESFFKPGIRRRWRLNLLAIAANVFIPWILFTWIYSNMCFTLHYRRPMLANASVLCGVIISGVAGCFAYRAKARETDPVWYTFAALAFFIATVLAAVFGDLNYWYNMQPYYDMTNLNQHYRVNPAQRKGQQLMDSGIIHFSDGAYLDMKKSIGYKNDDLYCVTPITFGPDQLASYDFWAIGMNCCDGVGNFHCGEYDNVHARSGLRLLHDIQRPNYRIAVQMAESAYNIRSTHPIFFTWMQDPSRMIDQYRADGFHYFMLGMACHFGFNFFCVGCAVAGFSRVRNFGYY